MKMKRTLCFVLSVAACFLTACGDKEHEHTWTSYIAQLPTCTENGSMERICSECSKQIFETIQATGHRFGDDGVCTVCGANKNGTEGGDNPSGGTQDEKQDPNLITISSTDDYGYTLREVYGKCTELGYAYSYEDFLKILCGSNEYSGYVEGLYVDAAELVHFNVIDNEAEANFSLAVARDKLSAPDEKALKTIFRVSVTNDELSILYSDSSVLNAGKLVGEDDERIIRSVALTRNAQVCITYTDNTAHFVGKIADGKAPEANSSFVYEACTGGYRIMDVIDRKATHLEIPLTFRGQPVVAIREDAFYNCQKLQSLVIGNNVKAIGAYTFRDCNSLSWVVIPTSVKRIEFQAFKNGSNAKLFFEGNESDYYFSPDWKSGGVTAYFQGEWSKGVNNEPHVSFTYESCTGGYRITQAVYGNATHLEIPATYREQPVVAISETAFNNCTNLQSLVIGSNVQAIGANTFSRCNSLSWVVIPTSVKSIGVQAFANASNAKLFFEGNESDYYFSPNWKSGGITTHFKDTWNYVDGKPQAN